MHSKGKEAAGAEEEFRTQGKKAAMAGGTQSQEEFRVGDAVHARCYTHGFRGYWPAEVVEIIPPPKIPLPHAETEARFVVKWVQDPQVDTIKRASDMRRRLSTDWFSTGSARIGRRVRRAILGVNDHEIVGFGDATVVGFLPARFSDFVSKWTGLPAPLWHLKYDDESLGEEDLEQVELEDALVAYASDAWSSLDKKGLKKRVAASCNPASSSSPAKRGTPGKRKKLVARLLTEADSNISLKQRSERGKERERVNDCQTDRGERRGGDKKQEKEEKWTDRGESPSGT